MLYQLRKICLLTTLALSPLASAKDLIPNEFSEAFRNGSPELNFRPRFEDAKQDGLLDAKATTLRTTVGYETGEFNHSTIKVELVNVSNFFGQRYNPGVSDLSKPLYSLIQDPKGAGLTEAKVIYNGFDRNTITVGRQYIQLDNERFIGKNDFRQYPQSFDAISLNSTMVETLDFYYAYLTYVNTNFANGRAFEARRSLSTHLLNADWTGSHLGIIGGYLYFNDDHKVNTNSNFTLGLRVTNHSNTEATRGYSYSLEIARQQSKFNNPQSYSAYYSLAQISKSVDMFTGVVGIERLSGNSGAKNKAFITPLGSVDNFNGMAEAFVNTPSRGLQDAFVTVSAATADISGGVTYHYFRLDKGPGPKRAGQEIDIFGKIKLNNQMDFNVGYAKYNAKNHAAISTRRFWVMLTASLI